MRTTRKERKHEVQKGSGRQKIRRAGARREEALKTMVVGRRRGCRERVKGEEGLGQAGSGGLDRGHGDGKW